VSDKQVYVMQSASGLTKVGMSNAPDKRRAAVNWEHGGIGSGARVAFATDLMAKETARLVEREAHHLLRLWDVGYEWFRVDAETAIGAIALAQENVANGVHYRKPKLESIAIPVVLTNEEFEMIDEIRILLGKKLGRTPSRHEAIRHSVQGWAYDLRRREYYE
jgi:hypothetical protein